VREQVNRAMYVHVDADENRIKDGHIFIWKSYTDLLVHHFDSSFQVNCVVVAFKKKIFIMLSVSFWFYPVFAL
jgi:hypothetical protein